MKGIPKLKIGNLIADIPIIQGGMGVKVSISGLASAVANEGGIGIISSVGLGDVEFSKHNFVDECNNALRDQIRKAKKLTDGIVGVNVLSYLSNATELINTSIEEGIRIIFLSAGFPKGIEKFLNIPDVYFVPIISSLKSANLFLKYWDLKFNRIPDALVLEGPLSGGHQAYSLEQLKVHPEYSLENVLPVIIESKKTYEIKYDRKIPIITAGGIFTGKDVAKMISLGADGVQLGSRFVCTTECDVSEKYKEAYIKAEEKDIVVIDSPLGMPMRVIRNKFVKDIEDGVKTKIQCPYLCLSNCDAKTANLCIADVLLKSFAGDTENGLILCGTNVHRIKKIVSVKELIAELLSEFKED